ncbi:FtsK/SpoIIIE domain-containing protein [Occultella kanbiaonis]|uniref:FtsK/SpoIIIE domain-containing protein n=1 Tax=Occultella kanbiaonis TaxID=2675754 RepID=UPI0012B6E012|nr:FtsK/SpoIIIE domain-containing protein [Occultella kanbiaonis]
MWRVSVRPSAESKLAPVDVVVTADAGGKVGDLAASLGTHLGGGGGRLLLAPTTGGRPWSADTPLSQAPLRDGDVLEVTSVPAEWLTRPGRAGTARAVVHVVAGPDAGTQIPVVGEVVTIGRSADAGIHLNDPLVSRSHAQILLTDTPVVVDQGSAHGTRVAGRAVNRPQALAWGEQITVGSSVLVIRPGRSSRAGLSGSAEGPDGGADRGVLRSPRFGVRVEALEHEVPAAPAPVRKVQVPWPMMLLPMLMGGAMFALMRNPFSLIFMLGFPTMMGVNYLMQVRTARREHAEQAAIWREEVDGILTLVDTSARAQAEQAADDEPELDVVLARATSHDHRLWTRQRDDADFLTVRAGRGPRPALVTAKLPGTQGDRVLRAEAAAAISGRATLPDQPVPVPLAQAALTAVVGPTADVDAWVRAAVVRLAVTHSPNEVRVAAVLGADRSHVESWLRWLPHAAPLAGGTACVSVGAGDGQRLLEELAVAEPAGLHTVLLVDGGAQVSRRLVEAVAGVAEDSDRRLHLIWMGESLTEVPAATDLAVDLTSSTLQRAARGGVEELTRRDALDLTTAWRAARALSGYKDEAAVVAAESMLPQQVRLPGLTGDLADPDDVERLIERWAASTGLRAQLGTGADGVISIDLREDGPHGLVAGTTGAGKSELLQSLIASLAINNPPSRITFLLVDYKGGAAFRECAQLPHSVGYITDLTPALVQRALTSLHAELTAREHLLATYGAKDLIALERSHPEAVPPSMLICVDEFAALLAEVPEFVDGMVSIAQRGRSLGMHMLLATQRPAGVVTPQIKANTDLRIALRVASPDDSTDVIDAPDAAHLSRRTPGRAWLRRTGHGTRELVQVAFVGAHEELHEVGDAVRVAPFTARDLPGPARSGGTRLHPSTDLERIVATATTAFLRTGRQAPKKPWIPPIAPELPMVCTAPGELALGAGARDEALVAGGAADVVRAVQAPGQVILGMVDRPAQQSQVPFVVDYARSGHLLVFGSSGAGKTELLRTLAASVTVGSHGTAAVADCVYGIDAGGGGLTVLERLGSVGSVVVEQQLERMLRLIRMLHRTVTERNAALASRGVADLAALAATGVDLQRIHLLVDNLPAVMDALEGGGAVRRQHGEQLLTILQEGRRAGVHITATAPQRTGLPSQLQAAFGQRLVMRMTVTDDYAMLGVPAGVLDGESPAGRALSGKDEVQIATLGGAGTPLQAERLDELMAVVADRYAGEPPAAVPVLPTRLPQHLLPAPTADELCLGAEESFVAPVNLALRAAPLLITGRSRSGRTSALLGIAQLARRSSAPPARIVFAGPRAQAAVAVPGGTLSAAEVSDDVLATPEDLLAWVEGGAGRADGAADDDWTLLLLDDLHEWERAWEANGPERRALEALAAHLTSTPGPSTAVVGVADPDDARSRQHIPGLIALLRRSRRAVLLSPEMGDGSLVAAQIPMNSHEPLTGAGRGLLVNGGSSHVLQLVSASVEGVR